MIVVIVGVFLFLVYVSLVCLGTCLTKPGETSWLEDADYHFFKPNLRHRNYRDFR
jgi:hypothetical protein